MAVRRILWSVIVGLGVLALVGGGVLGWVLLRPRQVATTLLISDDTANLRRLAAGRAEQVLASDVQAAQFRFPAISPDGSQVAYVATDGAGLGLFIQNVQTSERKRVYSSQIAQPFDIGWSPDGRYLVFLAPGPGALALLILPADGSAEPKPIAVGQNIYFAWSSDSKQLVLHIDGHTAQKGRVELYTPGADTAKPFMADPGFFQAPAFSHDGTAVFYVAQPPAKGAQFTFDDIAGSITRVGIDGKDPKVLVSESKASLRVLRSPIDDTLAYTIQRVSTDGTAEWGELKLLRAGSSEPVVLSQPNEKVEAFFWSPDGRQIAYVDANANDQGDTRRLNSVAVADSSVREVATFTPSGSLAQLIVYFDAYAHGYSPWSPDSTRLAYAAADGIYTVRLDTGKPEKVAAGSFTLWAR